MIILRQKIYSSPVTRVLYKVGKVKNKLTTLPARLQRDLHSGGLYKNLGKRAIADARVKEGTKSNLQLKREAIKGERKIKSSILEAVNASSTKDGIKKYAGRSAANFVEAGTKNPISTVALTGAYASTPWQITRFGAPIPGVGTGLTAAEQSLKEISPGYKKITRQLHARSYKRHWREKASGFVESVANQVL